jgi:hypothetical protein
MPATCIVTSEWTVLRDRMGCAKGTQIGDLMFLGIHCHVTGATPREMLQKEQQSSAARETNGADTEGTGRKTWNWQQTARNDGTKTGENYKTRCFVMSALYLVMLQLTPWRRALLEKLTDQLVTKFTTFHGTRRFITVFTRTRHGPYPEPDEPNRHPPTLFS